jgi:hypothetical protein
VRPAGERPRTAQAAISGSGDNQVLDVGLGAAEDGCKAVQQSWPARRGDLLWRRDLQRIVRARSARSLVVAAPAQLILRTVEQRLPMPR